MTLYRTESNWLEGFIAQAIEKNWCTKAYCSTCGSTDFREGILRNANELNGMPLSTPLDEVSAISIAVKLGQIKERASDRWISAIRSLILQLHDFFGEKKLAGLLDTSWAGRILEDMKNHYLQYQERRRQHEKLDQSAEEKRHLRQEEHAKRLERKKERDRVWREGQRMALLKSELEIMQPQFLTKDSVKVSLDSFHMSYTYAGLLEGSPNDKINDGIISKTIPRVISRMWGENRNFYIKTPIITTENSYPRLPPVINYAWLDSGPLKDQNTCGSLLILVWFSQNVADESLNSIIGTAVQEINWSSLAEGFDV